MKKSKLPVLFIVILLVSLNLLAQTSKNGSFSSVSNRIDKEVLSQKIDSLMAIEVGENQAGGAIGIVSGSEVLFKSAYGLMNMEQKHLIDENTRFDIASVSKQFTAYAILKLEQDGKLNLDNPIRNYLPQLPDYKEVITISHLLQHTSGIPSTDVLRIFADLPLDAPWNQADEIDLIMKYPKLNFVPNTKYNYSNGGYSLLAQLIEQVSGMSYSDYLKKNVFTPLSMNATFVYDGSANNLSTTAKGYKKENDSYSALKSSEDISYGAGNIYSSIADMIKWGQNILAPKFGVDNYLHRIARPYNTLSNGDTIAYTYGFNTLNRKGVKMVEHSGGNLGFRSQFMIFPDEDLLIILLLNTESINSRRLAFKLMDILLADTLIEEVVMPIKAVEIDLENVKSFEGSYQLPDGMKFKFMTEQNVFWLQLPGNEKFQLFAESSSKYFLKDFNAQCTFIKNSEGFVNEMIWHQGGKDYNAIRVEEKDPIGVDELSLYIGNYTQPFLKTEYSIALEKGELMLLVPSTFKTYLGFERVKLSHIDFDRFMTDKLGMLEFSRDTVKAIDGFKLLDVGRLQDIVFLKH